MKNLLRISCLLLISCMLTACYDDVNVNYEDVDFDEEDYDMTDNEDDVDDSSFVVPVAPPVTEERLKIENDASAKSPFLSEGCCDDPEKRVDDCCCEAVLAMYKKMKSENDPKLGEYKMSDPVLGKCKNKLVKAFDLVDNPPAPEPDAGDPEDDYGDDF